jgi:hypothetical protein
MQDLPSSMAEDHAHVEQTKRSGDDHKHVDGGDAVDLIAQEGQPGWRGRTMPPDHMSPDGCLADLDTQFEHFAVNPWRTPQRVGDAHLPDQLTNLAVHARPSGALRS